MIAIHGEGAGGEEAGSHMGMAGPWSSTTARNTMSRRAGGLTRKEEKKRKIGNLGGDGSIYTWDLGGPCTVAVGRSVHFQGLGVESADHRGQHHRETRRGYVLRICGRGVPSITAMALR
jgi:hypothetical protein